MANSPQRTSTRNGSSQAAITDTGMASSAVTPELVKEIADKVYAMLLLELKIERERRRPLAHKPRRGGGG